MADKKLTDLERVQARAHYNHLTRLRRQKEEEAFRLSLDNGEFYSPEVPAPSQDTKKESK